MVVCSTLILIFGFPFQLRWPGAQEAGDGECSVYYLFGLVFCFLLTLATAITVHTDR